jgi:hypothetical protein
LRLNAWPVRLRGASVGFTDARFALNDAPIGLREWRIAREDASLSVRDGLTPQCLPRDVHAADMYLACACGYGIEGALAAFESLGVLVQAKQAVLGDVLSRSPPQVLDCLPGIHPETDTCDLPADQ